jgi:hypothetical protein
MDVILYFCYVLYIKYNPDADHQVCNAEVYIWVIFIQFHMFWGRGVLISLDSVWGVKSEVSVACKCYNYYCSYLMTWRPAVREKRFKNRIPPRLKNMELFLAKHLVTCCILSWHLTLRVNSVCPCDDTGQGTICCCNSSALTVRLVIILFSEIGNLIIILLSVIGTLIIILFSST